ncbi:MAG: DUF433 domain-containing protein [bacterium]
MENLQICYEHITITPENEALIAGTTMRVSQLVAEKKAYGWSPEELHFQHPHLTLGKIYAALAYYADHTEEIDQEIHEDLLIFDRLKSQMPPSAFLDREKKKRS